jgi:alpha-glucosidase
MEWSEDGRFEDHASFVFLNRRLPVPHFVKTLRYEDGADVLRIDTDRLHLVYRAVPAQAGMFKPDDLTIHFTLDGREVVWHPGMPDTGNLPGTTRTLDGARGSATVEPLGPGLVSRNGWVVVDDSTQPLFDSADFRFAQGEKSPWPWVMERPAGKRQDWYFFGYGHSYKDALGDYVKVAGRIPLPSYFAFGTWWCRYWAYSDQGFNHLIQDYREDNAPLDVLVIDMDWHPTSRQTILKGKTDASGQGLGWTGFSWNKLLFPDPQAFLQQVHRDGLKVTLNLHPASGIQPWETRYPEMARAMGIDPASGKYVPLDITRKKFATNYMDIMHHPLEKEGVDFWWLDWQQGSKTNLPGVNPTWWLNYVYFTDQAREGKRPLLFGRWGGLGNHRYQIGFSGDVISVWDSLAFQPWFTATAANVGYAYWSHDIGGHMPGVDSPELYTRWIQWGVFSPILRTHSSPDPEAERRIWAYPEPYSDLMRDAFHLRYALVPYIYTEARKTYDTGVAFLRPLYYDWPEEDQAYSSKNEYMFGDQMLVAPVTTPADPASQLADESIWLPKGEWIEWETGRRFEGPIRIDRKFSIEQIPVYVRAGAILPMAPAMAYTGQKPVDPLILTVFPQDPGSRSNYTLYEDARDTRAYQRNEAAWTTIHAAESDGDLTIRIDPARGNYPDMEHARSYQLRLPGDWPPDSVTINGQLLGYALTGTATGWHYEGNTLTTVIPVPRTSVTQPVFIQVRWPLKLVRERKELDGFAGAMTRLREASENLNETYPVAWSPDALVDAAQTGDRLSYNPGMATQELGSFRAKLLLASDAVRLLKDSDALTLRRLENNRASGHAKSSWAMDLAQRQAARYQKEYALVCAQLDDALDGASVGE